MLLSLALAGSSQLYGEHGELWDRHRLPDFSHAGWRGQSLEEPPWPEPDHSITDFGAVPDDGLSDHAAFQAAAEAGGVIFVPAGTWVVDDVVRISTSGVVFRGEEGTVLELPRSLEELRGEAPQWSWNGGLFWVQPTQSPTRLAGVGEASRWDQVLAVDAPVDADFVVLVLTDDDALSLGRHLHNDQEEPGDCSWSRPVTLRWPVALSASGEDSVTLAQPLRTDVRAPWQPEVTTYPALEGVGFERLVFRFPDVAYAGHLDEPGYNGVFLTGGVRDAWVRDVTFENADNGVLGDQLSKNLLVARVRFEGRGGHHGLNIAATADSLFTELHYEADYFHAMTVDHKANGNVFSRVSAAEGLQLELDHHRDSPFENLFTAFSAEVNFVNGGSWCAGVPGGARNTFWGLPGPLFEPYWSHVQTNLVGDYDAEQSLTEDREWVEQIDDLRPRNLHRAQVLGEAYRDTGLPEADSGELPEEGCGCASGSRSAWLLPLLVGLGWRRRPSRR